MYTRLFEPAASSNPGNTSNTNKAPSTNTTPSLEAGTPSTVTKNLFPNGSSTNQSNKSTVASVQPLQASNDAHPKPLTATPMAITQAPLPIVQARPPPPPPSNSPVKIIHNGKVYFAEKTLGTEVTSKITGTSLNISTGFVPASTVLYGDIDDDELISAGRAADAEALKSQIAALRKEQCKIWSITDSIRDISAYSTPHQTTSDPPDALEPPTFPIRVETDHAIAELNTSGLPAEALSIISHCMTIFFIKSPAAFIDQWQHNYKANKMSKVAKSKSMEASADGAAKTIVEAAANPYSKVRVEVARRANDEAAPTTSTKRKPTAEEDAMQELAVLRKQAKVDQRNKKRLESKIA
eukprot:scaffold12589_cov60-Cyclotella_meneghiniana.AAC.1